MLCTFEMGIKLFSMGLSSLGWRLQARWYTKIVVVGSRSQQRGTADRFATKTTTND